MDDETIAALSTPVGQGAIAVVRVSGPETAGLLKKIISPFPKKFRSHSVFHGFVSDGQSRLDECLTVFFHAPRSYTGEDLAEISIHSNPFIIEEVLRLVWRSGARPALPGEFTYRAFRNGKLDLLQAEAVNDLIKANSRYHAQMEFSNLEGGLSALVKKIRDQLIRLGVKIETVIEFQEDQSLEEVRWEKEIAGAKSKLEKILQKNSFNELLNRGLRIAIAGKVNAGKSTLFNALLLQDRSIVSHLPGTTRDYITERIFINGFPLQLSDMAGIQSRPGDEIEHQGIARSMAIIADSDAVILVLDASCKLEPVDFEIYQKIKNKKRLIVANKMDMAGKKQFVQFIRAFPDETMCPLSAKRQTGLDAVTDFFKAMLRDLQSLSAELAVNSRQKILLEKILASLRTVEAMMDRKAAAIELMAEEVRNAIRLIGELTGQVGNAEILKGIFANFCIGK